MDENVIFELKVFQQSHHVQKVKLACQHVPVILIITNCLNDFLNLISQIIVSAVPSYFKS